MDHRFPSTPPPLIQEATYTKYVYQHSTHYVGVGWCIKWGTVFQRQENKWIFDRV